MKISFSIILPPGITVSVKNVTGSIYLDSLDKAGSLETVTGAYINNDVSVSGIYEIDLSVVTGNIAVFNL